MDIPIGVGVHCTDGPGGHSSAVVLNPVTKEVTRIEADVIYLKMDKAAVEHLPSARAR
jgi:hypothetical protein